MLLVEIRTVTGWGVGFSRPVLAPRFSGGGEEPSKHESAGFSRTWSTTASPAEAGCNLLRFADVPPTEVGGKSRSAEADPTRCGYCRVPDVRNTAPPG